MPPRPLAPAVVVVLVALCSTAPAPAGSPAGDSAAFFDGGAVPQLRIRVEPDQLDRLRADPRAYVRASMTEDGRELPGAMGLKLKGAAGSFRDWDDRPALTIHAQKFRKGGDYHGMARFHLNNSVQDGTYLHEWLAADLFHRAGIPAPRVTHARVWLNGRDVGLYVLKEGFDRPFLARSFADPAGNLYDGGFLQDLDADLEKDGGDGPDDRSDLRAVVEAARERDPARRQGRVEATVDVDEFLTFMAVERMIGHWDGYANKANNYRVYFRAGGGRAVFLPHGMDQTFEETGMDLFEPTGRIVAAPMLELDAFRRRYRERLGKLLPLMDPPAPLVGRVEAAEARLRPALAAIGRDRAAEHAGQVRALKDQLVARAANLREQLGRPDPAEVAFDEHGVAPLPDGWSARSAADAEADLDEADADAAGPRALRIRAGAGPCVASWRRRVRLEPGTYAIEAVARVAGVTPLARPEAGGVGVGRSGTPRTQHLHGTAGPQPLSCRFEVGAGASEVELVLEMRAAAGAVRFDCDSIRLTRQPRAEP